MAEEAIVPQDTDPDETPDLKLLEGKLVEITGVDPNAQDGSMEPVDVNGLKGRVVSWIADANKYAVEIFSGEMVPVSEENLLEYDPPEPEEGGFDICWYGQPNSLDSGIFAAMLSSHLEKKGCCVVQTFLGVSGCQQAWEIAEQLQGFHVISEDMQAEYLGREDVGQKTAWLYNDGVLTLNMDEFESLGGGGDASSALEWCDQTFTCIASHLFPYAPNFEDPEMQFTPWGRTNGLVRMSFQTDEERADLSKVPRSYNEAQELEEHQNLVESKKICMIYLIDAEGGSLTLHAENGDIVIPLEPNLSKIVVFREDQMSYSYAPTGRFLTLQAWLTDEPVTYKDQLEEFRTIDGPEEPQGERVCIMSVQPRYPGFANTPENTFLIYGTGLDGHQEMPKARWDIDVYYRKEHTPGFSMTRHGAMMSMDELVQFDNKFFGIESEYAYKIPPKDRIAMEIGYQALTFAGFTKETLNGSKLGVFCGDSGTDFYGQTLFRLAETGYDPDRWENFQNSTMCNRLSWRFGMVGPTHTSETACSSSLVATGIAHMHLRRREEDQCQSSTDCKLKQCLMIGINTLVGPESYIYLSGPGMLTHEGRCFTFNRSADGYARGEGAGAMLFRLCSNSLESMGRLAMLIGSCVNQDGRSASMTAPHGPSQSDVIKASMREAGLTPSMITIAECHGTGTSLGDPIEIGSLRAVMSKDRGETPLLTTTSKSNLGHLECGAGACGLLKCILMLRHSVGNPNCHYAEVNPHLDIDGFPIVIETENIDFGANSGLTGVSSFGFGGTNARADVWGHSVIGARVCYSGSVMKLRTVFM
mmetsp:Transcript_64090/g.111752  ORF Transcript_64090/g.111752 Transcript_64090/m.111752 type:complete len:814 (+) Transcript_64090:57-2498(+)